MGARALISIAIVATGGYAHAQARTASVAVGPECATVVDSGDVVVALRVELGPLGVGAVTERSGGDVAVAVECPSTRELVFTMNDRRTSISLADVTQAARARVLALAVASQLRPDAAPLAVVRSASDRRSGALESPPARWELGFRIDAVLLTSVRSWVTSATFARRTGVWRGELQLGLGATSTTSGWALGGVGEVRGAVEPVRIGRVGLGIDASIVGAVFSTPTSSASMSDRYSIAARTGAFGRVPFGATWSTSVEIGFGRAFTASEWFGYLSVGASAGL